MSSLSQRVTPTERFGLVMKHDDLEHLCRSGYLYTYMKSDYACGIDASQCEQHFCKI